MHRTQEMLYTFAAVIGRSGNTTMVCNVSMSQGNIGTSLYYLLLIWHPNLTEHLVLCGNLGRSQDWPSLIRGPWPQPVSNWRWRVMKLSSGDTAVKGVECWWCGNGSPNVQLTVSTGSFLFKPCSQSSLSLRTSSRWG